MKGSFFVAGGASIETFSASFAIMVIRESCSHMWRGGR